MLSFPAGEDGGGVYQVDLKASKKTDLTNQGKWGGGSQRGFPHCWCSSHHSIADQTITGSKGRVSYNFPDLITLKAAVCVNQGFSTVMLRRQTLTSLREVCEIRDLLSVGGGRAAKRRVGDELFLVYATLPRCVFLCLCSILSCCIFKLSAAYAKSQQGEENGTPLEKNPPKNNNHWNIWEVYIKHASAL